MQEAFQTPRRLLHMCAHVRGTFCECTTGPQPAACAADGYTPRGPHTRTRLPGRATLSGVAPSLQGVSPSLVRNLPLVVDPAGGVAIPSQLLVVVAVAVVMVVLAVLSLPPLVRPAAFLRSQSAPINAARGTSARWMTCVNGVTVSHDCYVTYTDVSGRPPSGFVRRCKSNTSLIDKETERFSRFHLLCSSGKHQSPPGLFPLARPDNDLRP